MTTMQMTAHDSPWIEVTERSDGHFLPFITAMILFAVSAIVSVMATGLPY